MQGVLLTLLQAYQALLSQEENHLSTQLYGSRQKPSGAKAKARVKRREDLLLARAGRERESLD